jgi:hypothetical protein
MAEVSRLIFTILQRLSVTVAHSTRCQGYLQSWTNAPKSWQLHSSGVCVFVHARCFHPSNAPT